MEDQSNSAKLPKTYQGLLRFCTEQTRSEDNTLPSNFEPMSEERKEFLQKVFDQLSENDPVKKMLEIVTNIAKDLHLHSETLQTATSYNNIDDDDDDWLIQQETLLDNLNDYCEDMDLANDFQKIGGFSILGQLLCSRYPSLRALTCQLIATLTQNNPYCQQAILNENILPYLIKILSSTEEKGDVKVKALYALSCLSRYNEALQKEMLRLNMLANIVNLLHSDIDKLKIKTAFLLGALVEENKEIKSQLKRLGVSDKMTDELLSTSNEDLKEQLLYALSRVLRVAEGESDHNADKNVKNRAGLSKFIRDEKKKITADSSLSLKDNLDEIDKILKT